MKSRAYLEMYNTPSLNVLLKSGKENNKIIQEILHERNKNFFKKVTNSVTYHEQ